MSVFKKINPQNKKVTPYQAHKLFNVTSNNSYGISLYNAIFNNSYINLEDTSDNEFNSITESNGYYTSILHHSLNNLFYYEYDKRRMEKISNSNKYQQRTLDYKATMFSIPQSNYLEGLKLNSVNLLISSSNGINNFTDDGYGNLIDTDLKNDLYDTLKNIEILNYNNKNNFLNINSNRYSVYPQYIVSNNVRYDYNEMVDESGNELNGTHHNMTFITSSIGTINVFNGTNSFIRLSHNDKVNFDYNDDFSISFLIKSNTLPSKTKTLITKNGLYTDTVKERTEVNGIFKESISFIDRYKLFPYPFQVQITNSGSIVASRYDGLIISQVSDTTNLIDNEYHYITFQKNNDTLELIIDGVLKDLSTDESTNSTTNIANMYIGRLQGDYFNGTINKVKIHNRSLSEDEYQELAVRELNNSYNYYAGNVFYNEGLIVLTNPYYWNLETDFYYEMQFRNIKNIYEHEYICVCPSGDLNFTLNPTIRVKNSIDEQDINEIYLSTEFNPYITTVGLYDDNANLLAIGKVSIPIRKLNKLDMNFVIRFDV